MSQRIEDSPGLFGAGVGTSTCSEFRCGICQSVINEGCLPGSGDELTDHEGEYERIEVFAGLDICEECMGRVERSVLHRLDDLLPWVARILASKRAELARLEGMLREAMSSSAGAGSRKIRFEGEG